MMVDMLVLSRMLSEMYNGLSQGETICSTAESAMVEKGRTTHNRHSRKQPVQCYCLYTLNSLRTKKEDHGPGVNVVVPANPCHYPSQAHHLGCQRHEQPGPADKWLTIFSNRPV